MGRLYCFISIFILMITTFLNSHAETNFDYESSNRILTVSVDSPFEFNYRRLEISTESNFKVHLDHCLSSSNSSCHDILINQEMSSIRTKRICLNSMNNFSSNKWIHCDLNQTRVEFKNVYSGFYCLRLEIYDKDNIQSARHISENPVYFQTDVVEQDIFQWNVSIEFSSIGQGDLSVEIQLEEPFILGFEKYYVDLFRIEDVNESIIPFLHDGWSWTDHPIHDYVTINASSLMMVNNNSLNNSKTFRVDFHNCTHGTYCVVVVPADGRCHATWLDEKLAKRTCERHSNIVRLIEGKQIERNPSPSITWKSYKSIWWSAAFVSAFLLALSLAFFILYKPLKLRTTIITDVLEDHESSYQKPLVSGSLLLLCIRQNEETVVQKFRKMKENLSSRYMMEDGKTSSSLKLVESDYTNAID